MSDIVFRRVRGRIVPIKRKKKDSLQSEPVKGAVKVAAGSVIGIAGTRSASKELKKSFRLFRESAGLRGTAKLAKKNPNIYNTLIRSAAKSKLGGMKSAKLARGKFGIALGLSTTVLSSGVSDFFRKDSSVRDEISGIAGTAAGAGLVALTARKFKIKASNISDLFSGFSARGSRLTREKIKKISKTKYNPKRVRKGTQLKFDL